MDTDLLTHSSLPFVVVWRLTEYCDLGCVFCGYSRELRRPRRQSDEDEVLAFGITLHEYAAQTGRAVLVSWLGGEPLLWPALERVGLAFRELGLELGVTTNGVRLSPAMCEHLVDHYAQVTASVDGLEAWHDRVRGSAGLYARVRAGVSALAELKARRGHGPLIRVNTVLMRSNLDDIERLWQKLTGWGVEAVTFNTLGGVERGGEFYERERLLPEHITWLQAALPGIRARLAAHGLAVQGSARYLGRLEATAHGAPIPVADCGPGRSFLFVDERGSVGPCSFTTQDYDVTIRDLRTPEDLARLPERFRERQRRQRPAACADCRSTQVFGKFDDDGLTCDNARRLPEPAVGHL